jgi:hypothetical protein
LSWQDGGILSYTAPATAARYDFRDELAQRLAGIDPLTDAAISS